MNMLKIKTGIVETNTYFIINNDNECLIIDPGDDISKIFDVLRDNGIVCKYILLTHAHFDHCNACAALQNIGAKIYVHKKDWALLKTDDNLANKFGVAFNKFVPDGFVKDKQILKLLGFDIRVLHTPGHTSGSCCYILENFLFTGDTLMNLSCGRTDFPSGNKRELECSLKKLFELDYNYTIFPGHYASTNLEFEKRNNPYVKC